MLVQLFHDKHYWWAISASSLALLSLFVPQLLPNIPFSLQTMSVVVFISPMIEEVVFRGLLQGYLIKSSALTRRILCFSVANLVCSVFFALCHYIRHDDIWMLLVFFPSMVFGYFRDRYRHILPSCSLHILYNGVLFGCNWAIYP